MGTFFTTLPQFFRMYVHLEEVMVLHLMYDTFWLIRPMLQERTLYRHKNFWGSKPPPFSAPPKIALLTVKIYILLGLSYIKRSAIKCTFRISFKKNLHGSAKLDIIAFVKRISQFWGNFEEIRQFLNSQTLFLISLECYL